MSYVQDLADTLARDVLAAQDECGADRLYEEVGQVLLAASPTLYEAFMTSIRIRQAERRGRAFFDRKLAELRQTRS